MLAASMLLGLVGCTNGGGSSSTAGGSSEPASTGGSSTAAADPGEVIELTFAHPFPATHHHQTGIIEPFVEEIKEASGGRINITVHPGGSIVTGTSALDDVTSGAVDMIWTLPGYTAGRFPLSEMFEFPDQFNSAEEATETTWKLLEENEEFFAEYNTDYRTFNLYLSDVGDIYTANKAIKTPDDLAGVSLRSPSAMVERVLQALGATTANMPMPEAYDNIERGIVDGLITGHSGIPTYKLYEVINYATDGLNIYTTFQMMSISNAAWDKLSDEDKELFETIGGKTLSLKSAKLYDELHETAKGEMEAEGVELYTVTDADKELFKTKAEPVIEEYITVTEGKGYAAQDFYDQMLAARDSFR